MSKPRLLNTFLELVEINSESFHEKEIHRFLMQRLQEIGCDVITDNAGSGYQTDAPGNIFGFLKGTVKSKPILLCAHMDTVSPGQGVKPVVKKDRVTSDGTTILGADDKAGLAIILEILQTLKEEKTPHPPVEVLFTLTEENGMNGAKRVDYKQLKSREGLILDNEEGSEVLIQGPAANTIEIWVKGISSHAGVYPEKGISAVEVAAYAISRMKLGRIDADTVANMAIIHGGKATNIVTDEVYIKGEARSLNNAKLAKQTAHMKACFEEAVKHYTKKIDGKVCKPVVKFSPVLRYPAVNVSKNHALIKRLLAAADKYGVEMYARSSGGGCDANVLSGFGFTLPNLGVGVRNCHTTQEYLLLKEFFTACQLVLDVVRNYKK